MIFLMCGNLPELNITCKHSHTLGNINPSERTTQKSVTVHSESRRRAANSWSAGEGSICYKIMF